MYSFYTSPTISENGTKFEFKPAILANTSLRLSSMIITMLKLQEVQKQKAQKHHLNIRNQVQEYRNIDILNINASVFDNSSNGSRIGREN